MAFGKKPCCDGCTREPSKARISGNPIAHLFHMGGEVMFADGGEARTDIGAADPEYTSIWPGSEYSTLGNIGGMLWRPFLRREVLKEEETRRVGDDTIEINPQTGMQEVMSTIQTFPGEYGPIESAWPTSMDIMNFGIENWLKAKAFLSTPEGREQALDIAQQLPSQAIEGAQDYMTQQVAMANRGLQETYDPATEEIKDFNIPKIAAEIMLGSLSRPAVQLADNELITGMAVRPKKAVVRPASTYPGYSPNQPARRVEMEYDDAADIQQYEELLLTRMSEQGFDPAIAGDVARKAQKYFMTQLGTADDPLRQAMLAGTLAPDFYDLPRQGDPEWSSSDKYRDKVRKALESGGKFREEFETNYDRTSGVQRTLVDPVGDAWEIPSDHPTLLSEAAQMLSEGVDPDLISDTHGGWFDRGLDDHPLSLDPDQVYATTKKALEPQRFSEIPEYLKRAYEQGEMVYEIEPNKWSEGLNFLSPQELAEQLLAFTEDEIRGRSFPDLVVDAQTRFMLPMVQQRRLARQIDRDSSSIGADQRNARVPTELKTEVGVTPVYETPNRTWYSLDTDGAVELEGALMNHSVGGYSSSRTGPLQYSNRKKKDFADGTTKVFSLRDKDGRSRVTTDLHFPILGPPRYIGAARPQVLSAHGYDDADVPSEHLEELFALWQDFGVRPQSAMPDGVAGAGAQYMMYLDTGQVFSVQDALDYVDGLLPTRSDYLNPDGDVELAEGGIVSLVKGCDFNEQRGNN